MGVNLVIAVTDDNWFDMLRERPELEEVNFWAPSAGNFRALKPGELFLFKLRAPRNFIVGGGVFAYANILPCSLAWRAFGESNGAHSANEMRSRIAQYRQTNPGDKSDFEIGCRILTQPFFLREADWIPLPETWSNNIVSLKTYSTNQPDGLALWETVNNHLDRPTSAGLSSPISRYGEPYLIRPRLGQGAFRVVVTDNYQRRCAVTSERTLPALEAAHIRPYSDGGEHEVRNGLLLRRDVHSLFDAGYVTVTPDLRFEVSRRIKEEFDNGRHYYALHGQQIRVPQVSSLGPDPHALKWHNSERYNG